MIISVNSEIILIPNAVEYNFLLLFVYLTNYKGIQNKLIRFAANVSYMDRSMSPDSIN